MITLPEKIEKTVSEIVSLIDSGSVKDAAKIEASKQIRREVAKRVSKKHLLIEYGEQLTYVRLSNVCNTSAYFV